MSDDNGRAQAIQKLRDAINAAIAPLGLVVVDSQDLIRGAAFTVYTDELPVQKEEGIHP